MDASKTLKTSSIEQSMQLSVLRAVACLAIVVLHTVFAANEYYQDSITLAQDVASRVVENNMMWAVPVFLMVTGALQLNAAKPLTLRKLYGRYIRRVFLALVVFSFVFRAFDMVMDGEAFSLYGLLHAVPELVSSKGWGHLWYLYLLIGLYVLLPFYRKVTASCTDQELRYLAAIYLIFTSLIPMIEAAGLKIGFYISDGTIYPLYLLLGYMMHEGKAHAGTVSDDARVADKGPGVGDVRAAGRSLVIGRTPAAILLCLSTVAISVLTVLYYTGTSAIPKVLFGYASPLIVMQAVGAFALAESLGGKANLTAPADGRDGEASLNATAAGRDQMNPALRQVVLSVDKHSFGIYLIHMVFVRLVFRYWQFNPYLAVAPLTLAVCVVAFFLLSYGVTAVLRKVPGVKEIV